MTTLNLQAAALPQYTFTLPVSKITCKFRPFVVREEKILLMALQTKDINGINNAMRNVILACTNDALDTKKLCSADAEYAFLQIRAKSVGEEVKPQVVCSNCKTTTTIKIKLDDIAVTNADKPKIDDTIKLSDNLALVMRYPSIHDFDYNKSEVEIAFDLARKCIESVILDDQVHPTSEIDPKQLGEFVDNLLPDQFAKMMEFVQSTPELRYSFKFTCPSCKHMVNTELSSVSDFFP
jgi:hypothetical protein